MEEKRLGKISEAKFGTCIDRPFLMGLQLEFKMEHSGCGDGGRYLSNIQKIGEFTKFTKQEQLENYFDNGLKIKKVLKDAKVNTVDELINKPVEVIIEDGWFKDFRILTEVI